MRKNYLKVLLVEHSGWSQTVLSNKVEQSLAVSGMKKMEPVLTIADSLDGLRPMQGSKYLSSSTEHTYSQTKKLLDAGRMVLFTGTPCQCAGLLNFLRKPYDNLLTMDFLCHGVPSQMAF